MMTVSPQLPLESGFSSRFHFNLNKWLLALVLLNYSESKVANESCSESDSEVGRMQKRFCEIAIPNFKQGQGGTSYLAFIDNFVALSVDPNILGVD